jgi:CRP/FNR family cyclic AMP-dependent transcriptional regulator
MKRVLFVLGQLSDNDIEWMIDNGKKQTINEGEFLVKQGESIVNIFIVLAGGFRIFNAQNPDYNIAQIGSGEIVGEMSFLDERPPSVSVMATQTSSVYSISLERMKQFMEVDTSFAARFYYSIGLFLSDRLRKTTGRLGYGSLEENEDMDEINLNVLSQVGQAGSRFSRMLNKFAES